MCGLLLAVLPTGPAQAHTAQCADGVDNDGDLKTDHGSGALNDADCTSPTDDSESPDPLDNGEIAFQRTLGNTEIYTMAPDGSAQTNRTLGRLGPDEAPAFSPDGTKIAFSAGPDLTSTSRTKQIYLMNADGSGQARLTGGSDHSQNPTFSPDGSKVAFDRYTAKGQDIYVVDVDGSNETRITTTDPAYDTRPTFSPDGAKIAFSSRAYKLGSKSAIFVMDADGSDVTPLTDWVGDEAPDFSPDGAKIAFSSTREGASQIYTMNADGSGVTPLTTGAHPTFSPDGRKIAFVGTVDSITGIHVISVDGGAPTRLTADKSDAEPDWSGAAPSPQCSDGADNDGDGKVDHPADRGCGSGTDDSESPDLQCQDGLDNDGDGKADHPSDTGCESPVDDSESPDRAAECSDGRDNDGDGKADHPGDSGCQSLADDAEGPNPGEKLYQARAVDAPPESKTRWGSRGAAAGDLDGDGVGDLFVVSDLANTPLAGTVAGKVYAVSGKTRSIIYKIVAPTEDLEGFGHTISVVGDLDLDRVADVAIGTRAGGAAGAATMLQRVYIFSGATGTLLHTLVTPNSQQPPTGADNAGSDRFGERVGTAGDLDGDGFSEVIVGAQGTNMPVGCTTEPDCVGSQGRAYIFNGLTGLLLRTLDRPVEDQSSGNFGAAVQGPGDVDGDGVGDQLVGNSGMMWVFSGRTGELLRRIASPVPEAGSNFGFQDVAPLAPGDVNGDGLADLFGSAYGQDGPAGPWEGRAWVFDGKSGAVLYELRDPSPTAGGEFGFAMDKTDYDKDGTPDLVVGSVPHNFPPYKEDGGVTVFSGKDGSVLKAFQLPEEYRQPNGLGTGPALGWHVSAPGDLNGDGVPDFVAGAPYVDEGDTVDKGKVFVFLSHPRPRVDFDGDADTDVAVFRPASGQWYARDDGQFPVTYGTQPGDVPVPGDYDGDGRTDVAIFRNGTWHIRNQPAVVYGTQPGDVPVPADYDGDGRTDVAIFRVATGQWFVRGNTTFPVTFGTVSGDVPVPGDYDGDGRSDVAIFRKGTWHIRNQVAVNYGTQSGDRPVPGDYDGNGSTDVAVRRPGTGQWFVRKNTAFPVTYGIHATDVALQLPYAVRRAFPTSG